MMRFLVAGVAILCSAILLAIFEQEAVKAVEESQKDPMRSNRAFLGSLADDDAFVRVTDKPFLMHAPVVERCTSSGRDFDDVHGNRYCDVYISQNGEKSIREGGAEYPVGTLVMKSKYPDQDRSKVELYTVMRKMPKGYWPEHGDWEFSVVDSKRKQVLSRGRVESCVECHDAYAATGYITRTYLADQAKRSPNNIRVPR